VGDLFYYYLAKDLKEISMKKMLLLGVMLVVVCLCGSFALALSPMGPPAAGLEKGQFMVGVDYSYSQMDIKMNHGRSPGGGPSLTMDNLDQHYVLANLLYGIKNNWEVSFRLGGGAAQDKEEGNRSFKTNSPTPGNGYVIGFGTKATFVEEPDIKWGALFQVLWAHADGRAFAGGTPWSANVELTEIQIALGPNYKLNEKASIYGGPFFHILDGRFTAKRRTAAGGRICYDLDEGSVFGGYIGTEINATEKTVFRAEYQHTAAADTLGMSLLFKLN
jgi:opacity protein-like surface antigen